MSIRIKLFLALVAISMCLVIVLAILMRWSVDRGMLEYVNQREARALEPIAYMLGEYFEEDDSWEEVIEHPYRVREEINRALFNAYRSRGPSGESRHSPRRFDPHPAGGPKWILLDVNYQPIIGRLRDQWTPIEEHLNLTPVLHDDELVGWLATPKRLKITDVYEVAFLKKQFQAIMIISLVVIALALLFAWPLAKHFSDPIRRIKDVLGNLRRGEYKTLSLPRRDELGTLARDVNELSNTLQENQDLRQRWLADTSHELRTPITILRGELEAMQDGVRPIDKQGIDSVYQEILRLQMLVEDLHTLSNADIGGLQYRKAQHDLVALFSNQTDRHSAAYEKAGLDLQFKCDAPELIAWVDRGRLEQMMDNLLINSLKYTDSGGRVIVELEKVGDNAVIKVSDSAPAVEETALAHLFEHLYRAEASRNRDSGGSGLGLAICKRIVEAHQGSIEARLSDLGGLQIEVKLPLNILE